MAKTKADQHLHPWYDFESVEGSTPRTRWDVMGAELVVSHQWSEGTYYIWKTEDGRFWRGSSWYKPQSSPVYEVVPKKAIGNSNS